MVGQIHISSLAYFWTSRRRRIYIGSLLLLAPLWSAINQPLGTESVVLGAKWFLEPTGTFLGPTGALLESLQLSRDVHACL